LGRCKLNTNKGENTMAVAEATQEARIFVDDVGSLDDVDWIEIATAYYEEIE